MSKGSYGVAKVSSRSKMASKWPVEGSGGPLEAPGGQYQKRVAGIRFLEASWGRLGGPLGVVLGPLGAVLAILEAS